MPLILCGWPTGSRERYGGTEFSITELVEKVKMDVVCARCVLLFARLCCMPLMKQIPPLYRTALLCVHQLLLQTCIACC